MASPILVLDPRRCHTDLVWAPGASPIPEDRLHRDCPDAHLVLVDDGGRATARCSCWWADVPLLAGDRLGAIGHFAASTAQDAAVLLDHACQRLAAAGCTRAVGPMDGNTWRPYRAMLDGDCSEAPFFLEPANPASAEQWQTAGFSIIARYMSAVADDLDVEDPRVSNIGSHLTSSGITIRPLDTHDADADLRRIFRLSLAAFSRNYLYAPISEAEFLDRTRPLLHVVRPELVLLAERHGALCGYLFAVPDVLEAERKPTIETVIIKTVAIDPDAGVGGLGAVLVARAHQVAKALGYRRAIHALMHEANASRNISRRYARPFRRYVLFARGLHPVDSQFFDLTS